jgi:hypothetical protein
MNAGSRSKSKDHSIKGRQVRGIHILVARPPLQDFTQED